MTAIFAAVILCFGTPHISRAAALDEDEVGSSDLSDDLEVDSDIQPDHAARDSSAAFDQMVFGTDAAARSERVLRRLEAALKLKIDSISRGFRLNSAQEHTLWLAGRGDIKRFIDRVEATRRQFRHVELNPLGVLQLNAAAGPLQFAMRMGPFGDDSLFAKSIQKVLTAEQSTVYRAIKVIEVAGGRIEIQTNRAHEVIRVRFTDTPILDDGLACLRSLSTVEIVSLDATRITDVGLAHLSGLTNLKSLDLSFSDVTGPGLAHLRGLPNLQILDLSGTQIKSQHLSALKAMHSLRKIILDRTSVTDSGIAELKGLISLEVLDLTLTEITDAGMTEFAGSGFPKLTRLVMNDTKVTDSGIAELKRLRPGLDIKE